MFSRVTSRHWLLVLCAILVYFVSLSYFKKSAGIVFVEESRVNNWNITNVIIVSNLIQTLQVPGPFYARLVPYKKFWLWLPQKYSKRMPKPVDSNQVLNFRRQSAEGLGEPWPEAALAVPYLAEILENPKEDPYLRTLCIRSLQKIGEPAKQALPAIRMNLHTLYAGSNAALVAQGRFSGSGLDLMTRGQAAETLMYFGDSHPDTIKLLDELMSESHSGEYARCRAAVALWRLEPNERRFEVVRDLLRSTSLDERVGTVYVLGQLGFVALPFVPL